MIDFDVVLEQIGGFGRYQIMLVCMVCYYSIPSGMNSLAPVFMNYVPEYRCKVPPLDNYSIFHLTEDEILDLTTPYDPVNQVYDGCRRYGYDLSNCHVGNSSNPKILGSSAHLWEGFDSLNCVNKSATPIKCDQGYHYDTSIFPRTVITEFNLVCDKSFLDPLATAIYMFGILIGSTIFGMLSDRLGRKIVMVVSCLISFGALISCSFVHTYWLFVLCRFFVALFGFGSFLTSFVYLMEIVSNRWRTPIGVSFQIFFAIGYMILSGIAYNWPDWHEMNLVSGIIGLPYALFLIFIPESPRWLFSNGKNKKAKSISRKFASFNKRELDEPEIWEAAERSGAMKEKKIEEKSDGRKYTVADLFKTKPTRNMTLKIMLNWFVNSLVYYGISLNVAELDGNVFVNNVLNGVMEIVSYIFVILLMDKIGRKAMLIACLAVAALGLLLNAIIDATATSEASDTASVVFSFMGKVGISGSYAVIYNFTSELYPTVVRSNGLGVASTAARLGGIIAPLVIAVKNYYFWLPNVILGVAALLATWISVYFPETSGINMMETIEEAEEFYSSSTGLCSKRSMRHLDEQTSIERL